jgi:hypothetical protein
MRIRAKLSASIATAIALTAAVGQGIRAEHLTVVPGEVADKQAYVTNKGIRWYTSLDEAEAEARKQGKLVFWLHMLGTIDGAT